MNSLAQQALERARKAPAPASRLLPPVLANESLPDLVITGPINKVMQREGRQFALEAVRDLGTSIRNPVVVEKVIANLTRTAVAQPSSYASGIKQVIDALKGEP